MASIHQGANIPSPELLHNRRSQRAHEIGEGACPGQRKRDMRGIHVGGCADYIGQDVEEDSEIIQYVFDNISGSILPPGQKQE